jgi:hypothetical protein
LDKRPYGRIEVSVLALSRL